MTNDKTMTHKDAGQAGSGEQVSIEQQRQVMEHIASGGGWSQWQRPVFCAVIDTLNSHASLSAENATLRELLADSSRKFEVIAMTLVTEDLTIHDMRELRTIADQGELAIVAALSPDRKGP